MGTTSTSGATFTGITVKVGSANLALYLEQAIHFLEPMLEMGSERRKKSKGKRRIRNRSKAKKRIGFFALFLGKECADYFAPDHSEEQIFLDHADLRE